MNNAFMLMAGLLMVGLLLMVALWWRGCFRRTAYIGLIIAALGYGFVRWFLADVNENAHVVLGVPPLFFGGNLALMLLGGTSIVAPTALNRHDAQILGGVGLVGAKLLSGKPILGLAWAAWSGSQSFRC